MKVNLAAQAVSSSVAIAIEYCSGVLKLKQFRGSAATVKSICVFDRLFDIFNSRNPCARGFKSALRVSSKEAWGSFLSDAFEYILHLKDSNGQPMYTTRRKTGFVGFLVAIESTKGIFHDLVEQHQEPLKYLLTYKMSQDHLELFFGAVRSGGGFNRLTSVSCLGTVGLLEEVKAIANVRIQQRFCMSLMTPAKLTS